MLSIPAASGRLDVMAQKTKTVIASQKSAPRRKPRHRTRRRAIKERLLETDSSYLLKLVVVLILGAIWVRLATPVSWGGIPFGAIPIGLIIGLIGVKLVEKQQVNRKIWYVVLIVVALVTYGADKGIVI